MPSLGRPALVASKSGVVARTHSFQQLAKRLSPARAEPFLSGYSAHRKSGGTEGLYISLQLSRVTDRLRFEPGDDREIRANRQEALRDLLRLIRSPALLIEDNEISKAEA